MAQQHPSLPAGYLFGYPGALRDALIAGLTLDTFNRHADKVVMANVAQLINTIHSLFIAYEDKFVATPNFHVFEMYAAHQGGRVGADNVFRAGVELQDAPRRTPPPQATAQMSPQQRGADERRSAGSDHALGLARIGVADGKLLTLTVVNPHATEAVRSEIAVRGAQVQSGQATTLTSKDIHAHNNFEDPRALTPSNTQRAGAERTRLVYRFPAASVTRLQLTLV